MRGRRPADLARLWDPSVMLVTAPMAPPADALAHAQALAQDELRAWTVEVSVPDGTPEPAVLSALADGNAPGAAAWVGYLEALIELFADLLGPRVVGVRQLVSDGPHCPRFHVDRVPARGVLTVTGPCTEWIDGAFVDRTRLGHAGGRDDATSGLVRAWDRLDRLELGGFAVFKGTDWPGAEERAIVHRSPPSNGERRLLLTLDCLA